MDRDWEDWLEIEQRFNGFNYNEVLQEALYSNAITGSGVNVGPNPIPLTTKWQGPDSQQMYQRNLADPVQQNKLEQWGWTDTCISYDLNSWGFRSKDSREFKHIGSPSLITVGCSFTFGTALPVESIWPTLVSNELNLELINLGVPGHGLDLSTQWLLSNGHTISNPKALVVLMPPPNRITWVEYANREFVASTFLMSHLQYPSIVKNLNVNGLMHYVQNINALDLWARSRNIPLYIISGFKGMQTDPGLARDLQHFGVPWHEFGAHQILKRMKNVDC